MITCVHPISTQEKQKAYSFSSALCSRSVLCTLHTDVDSNIANCMVMCVCLTYLTARVAGDQKGGLLLYESTL